MLLLETYRNQRLAAKRSPLYERNRFAKFLISFGVLFWIAYLIYLGTALYFILQEEMPNMEPYHVLNGTLVLFLILDFFLRFLLRTPVQEVKPYLLLPVSRKRVLDAFLIQAAFSRFNLIWLSLFIPFAWLSVRLFYGWTGIAGYAAGIWLLMVFNGYCSMLIRTLARQRFAYVLLAVPLYGLMLLVSFMQPDGQDGSFFMNLGEGYIEGNLWAFAGTIAAIICMAGVNRNIQGRLVYRELARAEDNRIKHVSDYGFLERYGIIGEYMRLELKLIFRNKTPRSNFWSYFILMALFAAALSGNAYGSNSYMGYFICLYCYCIFGLMTLSRIMSYEGNYMDGLMVYKETLYHLLLAKYYLQCIFLAIPGLAMILPVVQGTITWLVSLSYLFFTMGPVFALIMQLAVYNDKTAPLNGGIMSKSQVNTTWQAVITALSFAGPLLMHRMLTLFLPETAACLTLLAVGLLTVATHRLWIKNIYRRFMKRRYDNMEGFRYTR